MTQPKLDIRPQKPGDTALIRELHERVFGPGRFARTAYRIREASPIHDDSGQYGSRVGCIDGGIAASVIMTPVLIGGVPGAALLGPLVVAGKYAGHGLGEPMVKAALDAAQAAGYKAVLLVGDLAYYKRFGFTVVANGQITLPGPVDHNRVLLVDLTTDETVQFSGLVTALRPTASN